MIVSRVGVVVIGGGPAGLSAAIAASYDGASVLLVECEQRLGGVLKQCIHDGFGIVRYDERLTGPEYVFKDTKTLDQTNTYVLLQTFVSRIVRSGNTFQLTLCNRHGIVQVEASSVVLATGCRERTAKQVALHGTRPAGVLTAGSAQYLINIMGQLPAKRAIILGSSNLGLIMARRLSLEGAKVLGVYEEQQTPVGALQYVAECLNDFNIPLHLGHTVTRVTGAHRLRAVELCRVDKSLNPIRGSENLVKCDTLILAVGFVPENELAESLRVPLSDVTLGPICDQNSMTMVDGVFSCGNSMFISDTVDYISESGEIAGRGAARYLARERRLVNINVSKDFLFAVPHCIDFDVLSGETIMFFRSNVERENAVVQVFVDNQEVFSQQFPVLRPQKIERVSVNLAATLTPESKIDIKILE